jgi:hypothetical protein
LLHGLLGDAKAVIETQHAEKVLMGDENRKLRQQLFNRSDRPQKKLVNTLSRHMTSEENLDALAHHEWAEKMKLTLKEAAQKFRALKRAIEDHEKGQAREEQRAHREQEKEAREAEKALERQWKEAEKEEERQKKAEEWQQKEAEKEEERQRKAEEKKRKAEEKAAKDLEKQKKAEEREAERLRKAALKDEREAQQLRKAEEAAQRKADDVLLPKKRRGRNKSSAMNDTTDSQSDKENSPSKRPRPLGIDEAHSQPSEGTQEMVPKPDFPRPRPRPRPAYGQRGLGPDVANTTAAAQPRSFDISLIDPALR